MKKGICFVFFLFVVAAHAFGATFYVTPDGDDTNPGTKERPWRTPTYAGHHVAPGDVVILEGNFTPSQHYVAGGGDGIMLYLTVNGTEENRIIFDGSDAVFDGQNETVYGVDIVGNYITIKSLLIKNMVKFGGFISGHHNTFEECTVLDCGITFDPDSLYGSGGIYGSSKSTNTTILNNVIKHNGRFANDDNKRDHGLYLQGNSTEVKGNLIIQNAAYGLKLTGAYHIITNNTITEQMYRGGIYITNTIFHDSILANNIIVNNSIALPDNNMCAIVFHEPGSGNQIINLIAKNNGAHDAWCDGYNYDEHFSVRQNILEVDPLLDDTFTPTVHSPAKTRLEYVGVGELPYFGAKKPTMDKTTRDSLLELN